MTENSLLEGRVLSWSLPVIVGRPGPDAPQLKRMLLPQGELAQVHDGEPGMHYLALIELQAGSIRGNHYHQVKEEFVYCLAGEVLLTVEEITSKARASVTLRVGDLARISTGVAHTLTTLEPGQALEFSPSRFDPADIYPYPMKGV
jgi:quercetin dioxygenase-like cupin family protein